MTIPSLGAEALVVDAPADGTGIVRLSGELDADTAPSVRQSLIEAAITCRSLIIDLTEVALIDSTGFGMLVGLLKRSRIKGGRIALVVAAPRIRKQLAVTGLDKVFFVVNSAQDGLARLAQSDA